jgi:2'-hydroxyisoflavone reductase
MTGCLKAAGAVATRRDSMKRAASLIAAQLMARTAIGREGAAVGRAVRSLDILILGGTGFLGPHMVAHALARGHRVTLFNRGRGSDSATDPRVETLIADRDSGIEPGLSALAGKLRWDVVSDNPGYVPRHVRDSVELLSDRTARYLYVSTTSVYDLAGVSRIDENSRLLAAPSPETETVSESTYGRLKAEADRLVRAALGRRATVVRPN